MAAPCRRQSLMRGSVPEASWEATILVHSWGAKKLGQLAGCGVKMNKEGQ